MNRRRFLEHTLMGSTAAFSLNELGRLADSLAGPSDRLPVLFAGHGSPMNAIEDNVFSRTWKQIGKELPRPRAILCISAHWMTSGDTKVTVMAKPRTIHDFGRFPQALFEAQYPAPGAPDAALETTGAVKSVALKPDHDWGLDHGCWSVLLPMFPKADIPVFQLSLDLQKAPQWHYDLALELRALRRKGILIIGSGNIVHNLGLMQWNDKPYDWATEFDVWSKDRIEAGDHMALIDYHKKGKLAQLAIPTNEHYLPLLYTLALQEKGDSLRFFNEQTTLASVSMRSVILG